MTIRRIREFQQRFSTEMLYLAGLVYLAATALVLMLIIGIGRNSQAGASAVAEGPLQRVEVPLGSFRCIFGTHAVQQQGAPDGEPLIMLEFDAAAVLQGTLPRIPALELELQTFNHRIRQCITEAARSITAAELRDPALAGFRQRIEAAVNGLVGLDAVVDVVLDDFRSFELSRPFVQAAPSAVEQPQVRQRQHGVHAPRAETIQIQRDVLEAQFMQLCRHVLVGLRLQ